MTDRSQFYFISLACCCLPMFLDYLISLGLGGSPVTARGFATVSMALSAIFTFEKHRFGNWGFSGIEQFSYFLITLSAAVYILRAPQIVELLEKNDTPIQEFDALFIFSIVLVVFAILAGAVVLVVDFLIEKRKRKEMLSGKN